MFHLRSPRVGSSHTWIPGNCFTNRRCDQLFSILTISRSQQAKMWLLLLGSAAAFTSHQEAARPSCNSVSPWDFVNGMAGGGSSTNIIPCQPATKRVSPHFSACAWIAWARFAGIVAPPDWVADHRFHFD